MQKLPSDENSSGYLQWVSLQAAATSGPEFVIRKHIVRHELFICLPMTSTNSSFLPSHKDPGLFMSLRLMRQRIIELFDEAKNEENQGKRKTTTHTYAMPACRGFRPLVCSSSKTMRTQSSA